MSTKPKTRVVEDALGPVEVPFDSYYAAQTERSRRNFRICLPRDRMPIEIIQALAIIKESAALVNSEKGLISPAKSAAIVKACKEVYEQKWNDQFPLTVWQTGSGTQTNMNVNEVVAGRATQILRESNKDDNTVVHPNDDVNRGQSSNDIYPTAMNVSIVLKTVKEVIPNLKKLRDTLHEKSTSFMNVIKIGRTHLQDAVPMTVGQELSAFVAQLDLSLSSIKNSLTSACKLAVGGTAVGTGLNSAPGFDDALCAQMNKLVKERDPAFGSDSSLFVVNFSPAENKFAALAGHDALLQLSSSFNGVATVMYKLASDFALLSSGPNCGLGELKLPPNEPGSSIMPGKVNPTQCESMCMVGVQLMGNHFTVTMAASQGHLQLNLFKPMIALNMLYSCQLIADSTHSFTERCLRGLELNHHQLEQNIQHSLMLVTALAPHIGYDKAAKIAKYAQANRMPLRDAALKTNMITAEEFDRLVKPEEMAFPFKK